jgi:hypothetical protein
MKAWRLAREAACHRDGDPEGWLRAVGTRRSVGQFFSRRRSAPRRGAHAGGGPALPAGRLVGRGHRGGGGRSRPGPFHRPQGRCGDGTCHRASAGLAGRALYRSDGVRLEPLRAPAVAPPQAVASELAALGAGGEHLLAVGDGARRYLSELLGSGVDAGGPDEMWPSPDDVAALGCQLLPDPGAHASLPTPLYLRQADVRIGWEQVPGRVGANAAPNGMMARHRTVGA